MRLDKIFLATSLLALPTISSEVSADDPHWNYEDQDHWGALEDTNPATPIPQKYPYATCVIGKTQSPINLENKAITNHLNRLNFNRWDVFKADFYNNGHAVQVQPLKPGDDAGTLSIGRDDYPLIQFHFHTPSEHVIGAKQFAAELHFVHIREDGRKAVVGVLIEKGETINPYLQTIINNMPRKPGHNRNSGIWIDPMKLLPTTQRNVFHTYAGSLTTPPLQRRSQLVCAG